MYKITSKQLKWAFESPACRNVLVAGDSFCATGKFCSLLLGKETVQEQFSLHFDGFIVIGKELADLMMNLPQKWTVYANMNDSSQGSLEDNHRKALRLLIQDALAVGMIELEDDTAKEFFNRLEVEKERGFLSIT